MGETSSVEIDACGQLPDALGQVVQGSSRQRGQQPGRDPRAGSWDCLPLLYFF